MKCPMCDRPLVDVHGRPKSPILLIGEFPGEVEINTGIPWSGNAGDVLRSELRLAGIDYRMCRATNLWRHEIPKGKQDAEIKKLCHDWMMGNLIDLMSTATALFIMGSEIVPVFAGASVSSVNGTVIRSGLFPPSIRVAVAAYNPAIVLKGVVGDFRFAVRYFASLVKPIVKELLDV